MTASLNDRDRHQATPLTTGYTNGNGHQASPNGNGALYYDQAHHHVNGDPEKSPNGGELPLLTFKPENTMELEEDPEAAYGERESWANKREYLLSMIGFCVGIGNLWRFPYVCIRNGGGVFIIPFFTCLLACALPLFFLESALGQFMQQGPIHVWKALCPLGKGLGIGMNIICLLTGWYYTVLLAWSLVYTVHSFRSPLPWTLCNQTWNSPNCVSSSAPLLLDSGNSDQTDVYTGVYNGTTGPAYNSTVYNSSVFMNSTLTHLSQNSSALNVTSRSASEEFWLYNVLEISKGLEDMGGIPWHNILALFGATFVIFIGISKGIKSSGKVVYVTATVPYILLTILLIKGATLEGASKGVRFYLNPDFGKLLEIQTWVEACIQVFYSLGVGYGSLITMASYNKFKNNCLRDSIIVSLTSECTSIYGGFAIFTVLGHMAHKFGQPVAHYARSGPGLAFVVYPEAISQLPFPQFWGILFFVMLFTLGLDSQFNVMETLMTDIVDINPRFFTKWRIALTAFVMFLVFLVSIPFAARGGIYLFQLADWYIAAYTILIIGILECIIVGWVYGSDQFQSDIELMLGRTRRTFSFIWKFITPGILIAVFISVILTYRPPSYEGYHYNIWGYLVGWFMALVSFLPIPALAIHELMHTEGDTIMERVKKSLRPTPTWKPADPEARMVFKRV